MQQIESQNKMILSYLQKGYPITPLEALSKFGSFRLGARIKELRESGYPVITDMVTDEKTGKRYASYRLDGVAPAPKTERTSKGPSVSDYSRKLIPQNQQTLF